MTIAEFMLLLTGAFYGFLIGLCVAGIGILRIIKESYTVSHVSHTAEIHQLFPKPDE